MNRSISGYNLIAPYYDDLAGLIFGQPLFDAQTFFFSQIPDASDVLILGGGSGWILPILFKQKPNIRVCYIDASSTMIELARKKYKGNRVQFIVGTEESIPPQQFDTVILNFYVDGFPEHQLPSRLKLIQSYLTPHALWLVTDFVQTGKPGHRLLLWLTHVFFGFLIHHPNQQLVAWWKVFHQEGFAIKKEMTWNNGLIQSIIYSAP